MADGANFKSIRLDRVTRVFHGIAALNGLDLEIKRGEFIALLGPSGCGKSTALNCLAGLLPLTAGSIHVDDQRIDTLPPERRGFGMVFQNYALFPHMTVRRNIGFGLAMRGVPKAEARTRVERALALVQLGAHGDKLPGQLSGGQQQRVAIARAIVVEPPLVLMDEPLSNLDAKLRLEMRAEIRRIHRDLGRSTVYVTHDQDEALSMADRIVVLKDGSVRQIGAPEDLYLRPASLDVARFMGFRTLDVEVVKREGARAEISGAGLSLTGSVRDFAGGRMATIAIRPDDLQVGAEEPNRFAGAVETVEYCGRDYAVDVVTEGGARLHVRSERRVAVGERVFCGVDPERVLVFTREAAMATGAAA